MRQSHFVQMACRSKWRHRVALTAALLAVVLVFSAFSFAPAAHAASSSQASSPAPAAVMVPASGAYAQIGVVSEAWSVWIEGYNQYGQWVTHCLNIPSTPPNGNVLYNWWWNGLYRSNGVTTLFFYHPEPGYSQPYNCPAGDSNQDSCWAYFSNVNIAWFNDIGGTNPDGTCRAGK
jgi:hypothetical protein